MNNFKIEKVYFIGEKIKLHSLKIGIRADCIKCVLYKGHCRRRYEDLPIGNCDFNTLWDICLKFK